MRNVRGREKDFAGSGDDGRIGRRVTASEMPKRQSVIMQTGVILVEENDVRT